MKFKDWMTVAYVFGEKEDVVDIAFNGEDICTLVKRSEAEKVLALISNHGAALWWMYERLSESDQDKFRELVHDSPLFKADSFTTTEQASRQSKE